MTTSARCFSSNEAFHPTFAKVLVRYNPEGDGALNQRQASRLKCLSGYLHQTQMLFMAEQDRVVQAKKHMLELLQAELEKQELEKPKEQY